MRQVSDSATLLPSKPARREKCCFSNPFSAVHLRVNASKRVVLLVSVFLFLLLVTVLQSIQKKRNEEAARAKLKSLMIKMRTFPEYIGDVNFDQPWELPLVPVVEDIGELVNSTGRYLLIDFYLSPGLGNLMFQYATLRSIAADHGASVVVPISSGIRRAFTLDGAVFVTNEVATKLLSQYGTGMRHEGSCCTFNKKLASSLFSKNTQHFQAFSGYLQSFRYFDKHADIIRKEFTFLPEIREQAANHLALATKTRLRYLRPKGPQTFTYVGIHIRRGRDLTEVDGNIVHGHTVATAEYVHHAMEYFRKKYDPIIFVIATDNPKWMAENVNCTEPGECYPLPSKYREVDFAALTLCNHTIASTGTFSWWIAYMTNGDVVYSSQWPKPGTALFGMVKKTDFFPEKWIPME